jgi:PPP family 3-phenylpropionic acid transporter
MASDSQTTAPGAPHGHWGALRAAMIVQYAAGGAVIPFISMLLRDRGLDVGQLTLIISASSASLIFCPFLWGMLADRFVPLNRLLIWLNLGACVAMAWLAVQTSFWGLLAGFVVYTAFATPCFALVNTLGFHHLHNPLEHFGELRKWGSVGWIVPFLPIALWLAWFPKANLNFTLHVGMTFCLIMVGLSFWLPHTPPGAQHDENGEEMALAYLPAVRQLLHDKSYLVLLVSMFAVAGANNLFMFYSPPFLEDLGIKRHWIGPIQAIGVIFEIALFMWQARLIRRMNYTGLILAGCGCLLVRNAMFSVLNDAWSLSLSFLLSGAFIVFYHTGVSMLVNHMAGREVRATAQTLLSICSLGLGPMFANWAAGRLAATQSNSLRVIFLFATGLSVLATLLIWWNRRRLTNSCNQHAPNCV